MSSLAEQAAFATLRHAFPDLEVIEVIHHDGSNMTEQAENTEGWGEAQETAPVPMPAVSYPEHVKDPHNHRYTISVDGRGPMVVVRAQSAQEVNDAFQELLEANTGALMGSFWSAFKGTAQVGNGMAQGAPQAPSPQAQQAAQQYPTPPQPPVQQAPNQPYQGQPAWQQAGAPQGQPQQQWGGQQSGGGQRDPYPAPQGWMRTTASKQQMDATAGQYGIPKGNPNKGGKYNFFKAPSTGWYCAPDVAGAFAQYNPVPA